MPTVRRVVPDVPWNLVVAAAPWAVVAAVAAGATYLSYSREMRAILEHKAAESHRYHPAGRESDSTHT